ncbi:MAG: TIGR01244 family phosphatase [Sphingomonadaceae bacterium]|nr:TIGR01244 family phosphatase [Sphingomonadaceae bacterium]
MDARKIDKNLTVSSQISALEVAGLATAGFKAIVCNRPDDEENGQPGVAQISAACAASDIPFHHLPTSSGQFPPDILAAFRKVRQEAGGPVFAYCRTGTRCVTIDALANPEGKSAEDIIQAARQAGYDLAPIKDLIPER